MDSLRNVMHVPIRLKDAVPNVSIDELKKLSRFEMSLLMRRIREVRAADRSFRGATATNLEDLKDIFETKERAAVAAVRRQKEVAAEKARLEAEEAAKPKKAKKKMSVEDALAEVLEANGYDPDSGEADYEFMEGQEDEYADAVIRKLMRLGMTRREIAMSAADMDEGYTMFDDLVKEVPAAYKIRKEMKGDF